MSPFPTDQGLSKPVCVFCGSSPGNSIIYTTAAESVGNALASASVPLVYGGGRRGIMGVVSHAALEAGGYVHGILPRALVQRAAEFTPAPSRTATPAPTTQPTVSQEGAGEDLLAHNYDGKLTMEVVGSMHERKAKMAKVSQGGFIVLPGGYGTFEELMEMVTWNQIGMHLLPVLVLNIGNFYEPLRALGETAAAAGFIKEENLKLFKIVDLPGGKEANADEARAGEWGQAALDALEEWSLPVS